MKRIISVLLIFSAVLTFAFSLSSCTPEDARDKLIVDSVAIGIETGVYHVEGHSVYTGNRVKFEHQGRAGEPEIMIGCVVEIDYLQKNKIDGIIYPDRVTVLSDKVEDGTIVFLEELQVCMVTQNEPCPRLVILKFSDFRLYENLKTGDGITVYYDVELPSEPAVINAVHLERSEGQGLSDEERELVKNYTVVERASDLPQPEDTVAGGESGEDAVILKDLFEYLNSQNFVPGLSQAEFVNQLGEYSYNGTKITEYVAGAYYDGLYGGGYMLNGGEFGANSDYSAAEEAGKMNYSNSFYTDTPLKGLDLPYGIVFDDTLSDALKKMGIETDPDTDFASDEETSNKMTLWMGASSTLILTDCKKFSCEAPSGAPLYDYTLEYTESYFTYRDGYVSEVTRTITFSFLDGDNKLGRFYMKVNECLPNS